VSSESLIRLLPRLLRFAWKKRTAWARTLEPNCRTFWDVPGVAKASALGWWGSSGLGAAASDRPEPAAFVGCLTDVNGPGVAGRMRRLAMVGTLLLAACGSL
jgi:hypothetical protein